jgi:predicted nucleic acid-binding protein
MALYCDTSFFLALVFKDKNYVSVSAAWDTDKSRFSSVLLKFESLMAIHRVYSETSDAKIYREHMSRAEELFNEIHLINIDLEIYDILKSHSEVTHRTLDAIHLGTMLYLRQSMDPELRIGVYDKKLKELCIHQQLTVV